MLKLLCSQQESPGIISVHVTRVQAVRTGLNAKAQGDTGRVMVVLLTDGRANVSLAKSNEDPDALAEGAPKPSKVCFSHTYQQHIVSPRLQVAARLLM